MYFQVHVMGAIGAADHGIGVTLAHHHGTDQRQAAPHFNLGQLLIDAFALRDAQILLPVVTETRIVLRLINSRSTPGFIRRPKRSSRFRTPPDGR